MTLSLGPTPFSFLPSPSSTVKGTIAAVTDSTMKGVGQIITGGGTNHVMAFCDGTNWTVAPGNDSWFSIVVDRLNFLPLQPHSDFSAWTYTHSGLGIAAAVTSPDGIPAPQKLICDNTTNVHSTISPIILRQFGNVGFTAFAQPVPWRYAQFVRADGITSCQLTLTDGTNGATATFDLNLGIVITPATAFGSGWTAVSQGITPFGGGWYRCYVDAIGAAAGNATINFQVQSQITLGTGSFAGDGVSGIDLWRASVMPIHAWDLTSRVFCDDFNSLSTIDVNNTKAPGFNWYVNNKWPSGTFPYNTIVPTQSVDYSLQNSVLTLLLDRSGFGHVMNAAVDNGSGGFNGSAFQPPFLLECRANWASSLVVGTEHSQQVPGLWSQPTAQVTNATAPALVHFDLMRGTPGAIGARSTIPSIQVVDVGTGGSNPAQMGSELIGEEPFNVAWQSPNFSRFYRYSFLWLTYAQAQLSGGAFGFMAWFLDGVYQCTEMNYSPTTIAAPPTNANNHIGAFMPGETQRHMLILAAGVQPSGFNVVSSGGWPNNGPPSLQPWNCNFDW